jgi:hypothetical protein
MYCGDSLGTDIDHFEPIREFPAGTFVWPNHLLACSYCNSNAKRDLFPRDELGSSLLIDPTRDDPAEHLRLILRTGVYRPLTPKGTESIRVFGLNRADLTRGREVAFTTRAAVLGADVLASLTNPALLDILRSALPPDGHGPQPRGCGPISGVVSSSKSYCTSGTSVGVARVRVCLRKNAGIQIRTPMPERSPASADRKAMMNTPPRYQCGQNGISHEV